MDFDKTREYYYSDIMRVKPHGIKYRTYEDSEELQDIQNISNVHNLLKIYIV